VKGVFLFCPGSYSGYETSRLAPGPHLNGWATGNGGRNLKGGNRFKHSPKVHLTCGDPLPLATRRPLPNLGVTRFSLELLGPPRGGVNGARRPHRRPEGRPHQGSGGFSQPLPLNHHCQGDPHWVVRLQTRRSIPFLARQTIAVAERLTWCVLHSKSPRGVGARGKSSVRALAVMVMRALGDVGDT
jgi:hypothetical protein